MRERVIDCEGFPEGLLLLPAPFPPLLPSPQSLRGQGHGGPVCGRGPRGPICHPPRMGMSKANPSFTHPVWSSPMKFSDSLGTL